MKATDSSDLKLSRRTGESLNSDALHAESPDHLDRDCNFPDAPKSAKSPDFITVLRMCKRNFEQSKSHPLA